MIRTVTATEARVNFGRIMRELSDSGQPIVVERSGDQAIVMLSIANYERLLSRANANTSWQEQLENVHNLAREELGDKQLPDVVALIREMREERDRQLEEAIGVR